MRDALFYTIICMCFFYLKCIVGVEVANPELTDYLNKISKVTQNTILEKLKEEIGYIEMEEDTRSQISGGYKCVFSLFNDTFILLDNELYSLGLSNDVIHLKKIKELEDKGNIIFTKVTQFEDLGLILIKTEMDIDIYAFQDGNIFFVHSIFSPYSSDAAFFINQNFLYLILVNNRGDNLAVSIIYKWLGTYFDETEHIFTTGAIKVASFTNNFFEIIVISQYSSNTSLLSTVYEFNFGRVKKIQHINASNPSHMDAFQSTVGTYVLVFEKSKDNLIYAWNGSKLVQISQFQTETVINKSVTITPNNTPIIAVPLKDKIQTFLLLPKKMKLIGEQIKSNYSLILDIHKKTNSNHIYVVGLNKNNSTYISVMSFKAHFSDIGNQDHGKDSLRKCFNTLETSVYNKKRKLKAKEILSQVKVGPGRSKNTFRSSDATETDSGPESNLNKLRMRLDQLQDLLNDYQDKDVLNKTVIIKGSIEAEKLIGKDVNLKEINGLKWTPQNWLRYKEPQNITGPMKVDKIIVTELNTTSDPLFTELLTKNEDLDIWGEFNLVNLTANKILTKTINDIELNDVYLKSNQQPITGFKVFENLHTIKAKINILNGQPSDLSSQLKTHSSPKSTTFDNLLEIENLEVDTINNIHWNTFRDSVFKIGITKEINGDLVLPEFEANNITLKTLKGVKVEDLLTTSTDQVIDADIEFAKIFANDITTNTTNGIKLSESAVQFENNTLVEVPIKFGKLHVKNIELIGKLDKEFFLWNGDHIIGTNESDLSQSYEEVVKIKGNLYVKNFTLQPSAKLFLEDKEFNPDIGSIYWTKHTAQSIPTHFEAQNGLNTPYLLLNKLNTIDFNRYMLNKDGDRFESSYHFENISIMGDVILDVNTSHTPNLIKLKEEAVKTTGRYYIKGKKIYTDTLSTVNLEVSTLDGVAVNDTLTPELVANITEKVNFKNIIIKGNLTCNLESLEFINGVNITHLLETAIYIDEPQNIKKLHFKNVTVRDLWVTKLNNHQVNRYIENINKFFSSTLMNSITINGNVVLNKISNVSKINDIKFEELLNNTWKLGKFGGIMANLEFTEPVKVGNLKTAHINHLNLRSLTKRFLYRHIEQNVTALYSFKNIKTDNLVVSKINDRSMKNLIDVSTTIPQTIYAPDNIEFGSVILQKYLNVSNTSPCNLVETLKQINDPPTRYWNNVEVKGNATFIDPNNILYRVFEKAVTDNTENIIQAPVVFSKHILATNVITEGFLNDVNLQEILDDAVLSEQEEQIITGRKIFSTMRISEAAVRKNADIPVVNGVDVPELNKFIVRKDDIHNHAIIGKKTFFGGLQCNNLYTEKISNIVVENIVTTEKLRKIPKAAFDFVEVENNLNISSINNFDFDGFLKTRLLTDGVDEQTVDGIYFFDNIQVEDMKVPSINHITMDNVVFDIGQQNITASKQFSRTVEIFGNLTCPYINGINISEIHKKIIGNENTIKGSLTILRPSVVRGNITTEYINGYPVEQIKEILNQGTIKSEIEKIRHIKDDIVDKIKRNIDHIKFLASDYMYIEKSQALQISVPNTISANTMESNGYVLIHVNGEESGETCGLLESCKCPIQYTIEVSPEHSVAIFPNKGTQRIFTYEDDGMIIHFLTNSFSTDSKCRSEQAKVINEVSMMTWNTPARGNTTGGFHQYNQYITGYISGAEFFTLHGYTYAIIGRYYNPATNSHDLDCYLIKFSHDKTTAKKIQQIPTAGAWSVYLFHTAQGVTLIIGNIKNMNNTHQSEEETKIYRFNEQKQTFDLLRIVPSYGCSMATGVVLGTDSLIVLAHRYEPLQVLKYNPNFDNYYFYQSFELEAPVVGISVFYTGGFGISDAYLCTVTANENYFIYSFRFIEGWKLESSGELEGLKDLIHFELNKQSYLFAPSSKISSLLTVVKHGSV